MADLSTQDLLALRQYAAGAQIAQIANTTGRDREELGLRLADLCGLNRMAARDMIRRAELARAARPAPAARFQPPPSPPPAAPATGTAPAGAEVTRLRAELDAVRTRATTLDRQLTQARADLAAAEHAIKTTPPPPPPAPPPVAEWSTTWCPRCRHVGPADTHQGCPGRPVPAVLTVAQCAELVPT